MDNLKKEAIIFALATVAIIALIALVPTFSVLGSIAVSVALLFAILSFRSYLH